MLNVSYFQWDIKSINHRHFSITHLLMVLIILEMIVILQMHKMYTDEIVNDAANLLCYASSIMP